jgi:hypothetical protein
LRFKRRHHPDHRRKRRERWVAVEEGEAVGEVKADRTLSRRPLVAVNRPQPNEKIASDVMIWRARETRRDEHRRVMTIDTSECGLLQPSLVWWDNLLRGILALTELLMGREKLLTGLVLLLLLVLGSTLLAIQDGGPAVIRLLMVPQKKVKGEVS